MGCGAWRRSGNGPEFAAKQVRKWPRRLGGGTVVIEPGSLWENGHIESFKGKLRDEFLNGELFNTLLEAKVLTERWPVHHNRRRLHSAKEGRDFH